jgi:hypothetical protein
MALVLWARWALNRQKRRRLPARAVRDSSILQGVVSAEDNSETSGLQRAQVDLAKTVASLMKADRLWSEVEEQVLSDSGSESGSSDSGLSSLRGSLSVFRDVSAHSVTQGSPSRASIQRQFSSDSGGSGGFSGFAFAAANAWHKPKRQKRPKKRKNNFLFEKARLTNVIAAELRSLDLSEAAAFVGEHAYLPKLTPSNSSESSHDSSPLTPSRFEAPPGKVLRPPRSPLGGRAAAHSWLMGRHDAATAEGVLAALEKADYAEAEWLHELQASHGRERRSHAPLPTPTPQWFVWRITN